MVVRGRAWRLGDNISTDHIISGKYKYASPDSLEGMLPHVLEEVIPDFHRMVRPGDVIVAGRNFGCGSSREHAPRLLKMSGISAIIAVSFARIFYRNAVNIGLPVIEARRIPEVTRTGDIVEVDLENGVLRNVSKGVEERFRAFPRFVLEILREGGLASYVRRRGDLVW